MNNFAIIFLKNHYKGKVMQTLKIELEDSMYQNVVQSGIDIQGKVKEFLFDLVDDGYPAITKDEAQRRVSEAIQRYKNGTGTYLNEQEYDTHINSYMENLKLKYANN
jgi:polyhydroxyalkanoate synthesis regulator phasin